MTAPASAIVVAGGRSSRLGQDKRQLRLTSSRTLLEETIERVSALADDVVVVASDVFVDAGSKVRFVPDPLPGAGPLNGLCGGLSAVQNQYAIAVACDLPFLSVRLLRALLDFPRDFDLLVPRRADGTLEMLQAVYCQTCLDAMRRRLSAGRLKLADLVEDVKVRFVDEVDLLPYDPELRSFLNVNTPRDLATIMSMLP